MNAGGVVAKDTRETDKLAAYTTYVALLDAYNLTEKQIPLLSMSRGTADHSNRTVVADMSRLGLRPNPSPSPSPSPSPNPSPSPSPNPNLN